MSLITISQNLGSGGMAVARTVAEGLDLELYDDDKLQEEAVKMGIRSEDLKGIDEKMPGLFDRILGRKPEIYLDFMEAVVYEVSQRGQGVIIGHCSQMLLRDFGCAMHIFVHASQETRIRNLMEIQNVSRDVAFKLIRKNDQQRNGFFKYNFQMDLSDPSLYDLTINTEKIGNDAAAKFIIDLALSEEIKACSLTALESMERLSLQKKVHAALLQNDFELSYLNIDVPESGVVIIGGLVFAKEEQIKIVETAKEVEGVSDVQSEITVSPPRVT